MSENKGTVIVRFNEQRAKLLERRIQERDTAAQQEIYLQQQQIRVSSDKIRAQGKCDGLVELIAEEEGVDWSQVQQYSADTDKRILTITFKPEDPGVDSVPTKAEGTPESKADNVVPITAQDKVETEEKEEVSAN